MTSNSLRWLGLPARLILGGVLIWAGWSKLHSPRLFTQTVRAFDATPEWLSRAIGYGLPLLEIAVGVLLVVGIATRLAAAVSGVLTVVFLVGIVEVAVRGIKLNPGLIGYGGYTTSAARYPLDLLAVVGLLALSVYLVTYSRTRVSIEDFLARNDYVEPPSRKRMRSEQGQRKYTAAVQARRRAAQVRARYVNSSLGIVIALVTIIGIGVQSGRAKITSDPSTDNVSAKYGVVYGKVAAARVDVYEDFACAQCRMFEQAVHTTLEADVKANLAQVHYYPVSFLDPSSKGYSTRAANAAVCAADSGVDAFVRYHDVLFGTDTKGKQVQPAPGKAGPGDNELIDYARQAKLTSTQVGALTSCVQIRQYVKLVQAITENASARGATAGLLVRVNGKRLSNPDLATLVAAIAAADAKGPKPSPSPTPTVSTTPSATASPSPSPSKLPTPTPGSAKASGAPKAS